MFKCLRYLVMLVVEEKKFGKGTVICRKCGRSGGVIRKYGLNYCRQCFREIAKELGFKKYS